MGRKRGAISPIQREVVLKHEGAGCFQVATIPVLCPECGSGDIAPNGTRPRKDGRVEAFICRNSTCAEARGGAPRQFVLTSSRLFAQRLQALLAAIWSDILAGAKATTVARNYGVSDALISVLRDVLEESLPRRGGSIQLVAEPLQDRAVAIDETFFTIGGKTIYVILATGVQSRQVLGVRVSSTRQEADMRAVFDEAERNTAWPIEVVTTDGWSATRAMAANLGRPITVIIHPHKAPYDRAVVRRIQYEAGVREIYDVGVKTDFCVKRARREFYHMKRSPPQAPKRRGRPGRPKGTRARRGRGKPRRAGGRGKQGVLAVFRIGKRGYAKVDPYRKTVVTSKGLPPPVANGLADAIATFGGTRIQNNIAETMNSVLQSLVRLKGCLSQQHIEDRVRGLFTLKNDPSILSRLSCSHVLRGSLLLVNLKVTELVHLHTIGWDIPLPGHPNRGGD